MAKLSFLIVLMVIIAFGAVLLIFGAIYKCNGVSTSFSDAIFKSYADMISSDTYYNTIYGIKVTPTNDCYYIHYNNDRLQGLNPCIYTENYFCVPRAHPTKIPLAVLIIIHLVGILFNGFIIGLIVYLYTSPERFVQGKNKYHVRNHIVILGYNDMVPGMIERIIKEKGRGRGIRIIVGVQTNVHETYLDIRNTFRDWGKYKRNIVVLQASACSRTDLMKRIKVQHANFVYIIGEHDDASNIKCYEVIRSICSKRSHCPECYVQMQYQSTYALFQTYTKIEGMKYFHAFNFHNEWARTMLKTRLNETFTDTELSEKQVHLVIVGMTAMGEALAREAAFVCHYPNFVNNKIRTKITFIDPNAKKEMTNLMGRYHHLFQLCHWSYRDISPRAPIKDCLEESNDFLDIEFEFIEAHISENTIRREISEWTTDPKQLLTIAICSDKPQSNMAAGLYLPSSVFREETPIWIYQPDKANMGDYLEESCFNNITTFGMSGKDLDIRNEEGIRRAKRLNHFYCYLKDKCDLEDMKIDYSDTEAINREWDSRHVFDKWSNVYNVLAFPVKLRSVGIDINKKRDFEIEGNDVEILAQVEHNRWNVEKLLMGFRPTTKEDHQSILANSKKKEEFVHDGIKPYKDLTDQTKNIDRWFTKEIPRIIGE